MISLRQLQYLDSLAKTGHYGRAAERVGVSQPALSVQIREMEARLGVTLVERLPQGARLTAIGNDIAARAAKVLADVRDIESVARASQAGLGGPLRLGVIPSIAPAFLPDLLPRLLKAQPDLQLTVRETITQTLVDELVSGALDIIVASQPLNHPHIEVHSLYMESFVMVVSQDDPLAARKFVSSQRLRDSRVLLLEDGHCLRAQVLQACGLTLGDNHSVGNSAGNSSGGSSGGATSLSTLIELVANGQGITLIPEKFVHRHAIDERPVRVIRFSAPEPKRAVVLAWRRNNPMGDAFQSLVPLMQQCAGKK